MRTLLLAASIFDTADSLIARAMVTLQGASLLGAAAIVVFALFIARTIRAVVVAALVSAVALAIVFGIQGWKNRAVETIGAAPAPAAEVTVR